MALKTHHAAGWEIRPHAREDRDAIKAVLQICLQEFPWHVTTRFDPDALEHALSYTTAIVATEKKAGIVGFMIVNTESGYVSHIFVLPEWRLCGIGSGLLEVGRVLSGKRLFQELDERNKCGLAACAAMGWSEMVAEGNTGSWQVRLVSE